MTTEELTTALDAALVTLDACADALARMSDEAAAERHGEDRADTMAFASDVLRQAAADCAFAWSRGVHA